MDNASFKFRLTIIVLLLSFTANAQRDLHEADITVRKENGQQVRFYQGEKLQGLCKIRYITDDFVLRYKLSTFRDGIEGDTVRFYDYKTNTLLEEEIRLGEGRTHHREYFYSNRPFREYDMVGNRLEGTHMEWYDDEKSTPYRSQEYVGGRLHGKSIRWDNKGRIESVCNYRDNLQDGWSEEWSYGDATDTYGTIHASYYREGGSPVMTERWSFYENWKGLEQRTVFDGDGRKHYVSENKKECDSTRIDTVAYNEGVEIEIRDYKRGLLLSLERYTRDMTPHGIFETYDAEGNVTSRMNYEYGELTETRYYDPEEELRDDIEVTLLTEKEFRAPDGGFSDSKHFEGCDDSRPLRIRNEAGEAIFERDEEDRRYEYHGYDPELNLHVAFSSIGDYNDAHWYVVHKDGGGDFLELRADYLAVNGNTGLIAAVRPTFEGEYEVTFYKHFTDEEYGGYFASVFEYYLQDLPSGIWSMHWIGDHALIIQHDKEFIRLDIAPESLTEPREA